MLVVYREGGRWEDRTFRELPLFLGPGDCLALNDSRVFPARLYGHRAGVRSLPIGKSNPKRHEYLSGEVEVFLLRPVSSRRPRMGGAREAGAQDAVGRANPLRRPAGGGNHRARRVRRTHGPLLGGGRFVCRVRKDRARPVTSLHQAHRPACRPGALPDRLRPRERIGGRTHRGAALHRRGIGCLPRARRGGGAGHATRRAGDLSAAACRTRRRRAVARRALPHYRGERRAAPRRRTRRGGGHHQRAHHRIRLEHRRA